MNRVTIATSNDCDYFDQKQDKKCRWRTNDKKTNIFIVKAIASGTISSSTNQEDITNSEVKEGEY